MKIICTLCRLSFSSVTPWSCLSRVFIILEESSRSFRAMLASSTCCCSRWPESEMHQKNHTVLKSLTLSLVYVCVHLLPAICFFKMSISLFRLLISTSLLAPGGTFELGCCKACTVWVDSVAWKVKTCQFLFQTDDIHTYIQMDFITYVHKSTLSLQWWDIVRKVPRDCITRCPCHCGK